MRKQWLFFKIFLLLWVQVLPACVFRYQQRFPILPQHWSYRKFWATMWVLGIKLRSPGRAVRALNCEPPLSSPQDASKHRKQALDNRKQSMNDTPSLHDRVWGHSSKDSWKNWTRETVYKTQIWQGLDIECTTSNCHLTRRYPNSNWEDLPVGEQ